MLHPFLYLRVRFVVQNFKDQNVFLYFTMFVNIKGTINLREYLC